MAYPNTSLGQDVADPPFGGQPADRFGIPQASFIDAVLQFLEKAYLSHLRSPWMQMVVNSASGNAVGDVCYFDQGTFVSASGYYARNKTGGSGSFDVLGVFLDAASAGAKVRVAFCGLIPPAVTGLGVQPAATNVAADNTTGRLKVAGVGDAIIGRFDVQGNVFLFAPGRLL